MTNPTATVPVPAAHSRPRLLVVEDDPEMRAVLERGLSAEGYEVTAVESGMEALIELPRSPFAIAVVDVMLPGMNGFELCRHVRATGSGLPILLLTARDAVEDRVTGLDSGADDYLVKPFAFAELLARVRALSRRDHGTPSALVVGRLTIDSHHRTVDVDGRQIGLSPKEFTLLRLLASHPGTAVSRESILSEVWGSTEYLDHNVVEQYVSYLRKKLDPGDAGVRIVTARGIGYRLEEEPLGEPG